MLILHGGDTVILIMGVFNVEVNPLRRIIHPELEKGEVIGRPFIRGVIGPNEVVVTYGFVGKVEAAMLAQAFIDRFNPNAIVFTGAAGALSKILKIGDVVLGDEYFEFDVARRDGKVELIEGSERLIERFEEHYKDVYVGRIATGDSFIDSEEMREKVKKMTQAVAVDMDSAAVAKVAKENGIDFVSLKTIVDDCSVESFEENYEKFAGKAAMIVSRVIDHHTL